MQFKVIVGPCDDDGNYWYFSLNNRRLWVLKRCREEGLLENNLVQVRVRPAKSSRESERYTLKNCALEARFISEKNNSQNEIPLRQNGINVENADINSLTNEKH
mmetsp:Transcript_6716/g.9680  ORF Transcript_6716/g.9680 Transcript_6716/m.9680 type:complete len:104 (-) Transcript_6716:118-429(-)